MQLFYIYDPMCSWCWAYQPTLDQLNAMLEHAGIEYTALLGGLAPDTKEPMPKALQLQIQSYWRNIEAKLGTRFNHDFWTQNTPRRATYPACRAIIAAREFNKAWAIHDAIQIAYYERALNPSDDSILCLLASEIGLPETFEGLLNSPKTQQTLDEEIQLARSIGGTSFPSWICVENNQSSLIQLDYASPKVTFQQIVELAER